MKRPRRFAFLAILLALLARGAPAQETVEAAASLAARWESLLATHLEGGNVDYAALSEAPAELASLAGLLERAELGTLSEPERTAFWINAYNILVVAAVVERYPIASPRAIPGFFDRARHRVAGERLTLDEIEDRLRRESADPRIHFALVCAARSCPPLVETAYRGENLDAQLERRAEAVLSDSEFVRVDAARRTIVASKIFDWYRHEFETPERDLGAYFRAHGVEASVDFGLEFLDYDWSLNDRAATIATGATEPAPELAASTLRFTPSKLLVPGEIEIQIFNNLYTQTSFFDADGEERDQGGRSTYYTGTISFKSGWKERVSPGVDFTLKYVTDETFRPEDHPFFRDDSRGALTAITPNVQLLPFRGAPTLSIETGFQIPTESNLDGFEGTQRRWPFLDYGGFTWWNEIFYDWSLSRRFLAFFRLGALLRFDSDDAQLTTPVTSILNFYPTSRWTIYGLAEIGPDWIGDGNGNYYSQFGGGLKFRATPGIEIEVLATTFPFGVNNGAGQTFNLGLRLLD